MVPVAVFVCCVAAAVGPAAAAAAALASAVFMFAAAAAAAVGAATSAANCGAGIVQLQIKQINRDYLNIHTHEEHEERQTNNVDKSGRKGAFILYYFTVVAFIFGAWPKNSAGVAAAAAAVLLGGKLIA